MRKPESSALVMRPKYRQHLMILFEGDMSGDRRPIWDSDLAGQLIGCVVLVGIAYDEPAGQRFEQFYGSIEEAAEGTGVLVRLSGSRSGEHYWLPPDLRAFSPADPGEYRLRSTGEIVTNPDYLSTWRITPPTN